MTQIISVITQDYVLLASDRKVTDYETGNTIDDDTCKLVSLCNTSGIAYTGIAALNGVKTHEWILMRLAEANCRWAQEASRVIRNEATRAFKKHRPKDKHHTFLLAGWDYFEGHEGIRPHFCSITNMLDEKGKRLDRTTKSFNNRIRALKADELVLWHHIGIPLDEGRRIALDRYIRELTSRGIGPKSLLRLLKEEIINTSTKNSRVGSKILGMCIPKNSVQNQLSMGFTKQLANQPTLDAPTFTYFESGYSEMRQLGPSYVCGGTALTDIETQSDPGRNYQSSQARIISFPQQKTDNLK